MLKIIIDTREQAPFQFNDLPVETIAGTLNTGDYSLSGFTDKIALERKSIGDLISCLTSGRDRFYRELERLRSFESVAIVVEGSYSDIASGNYRSKLNPASAVQSITSIIQQYRMPFYFANGRQEAEQFAFDFLRHYYRHKLKEYKAILNADS